MGAETPLAGTDTFVGRTSELEWLEEHLASHRLVVVLGPPGIGKSRLVREYLRFRARGQAIAAVWVDLRAVRDEPALIEAVRRAVRVAAEPGGEFAAERLGSILNAQGTDVLVLDDMSSVPEAADDSIKSWLRQAPGLRVVVTSRVRLASRGAALLDLPPLSTPEGDHEAVAASDAVRLLLARGRAWNAQLSLRGSEVAFEGIARELGGLPLALELAAARLRVLSPAELLATLREPRAPAGRRSELTWRTELESSLAMVWSGLAAWERAALVALATFRGGFSLDSVHATVDLSRWPHAPEVVDVLAGLQDKSLVSRSARGAGARFQILEPIRSFVERQCEPTERRAAFDRHAAHFRGLSRACSARMYTDEGPELLVRLGVERENLIIACRRLLAGECGGPDPDTVLDILIGSAHWSLRNEPGGDFAALMDEVVSLAGFTNRQTRDVALGFLVRAESRRFCGDPAGSERDIARALSIGEAIGDLLVRGRALCARGGLRMNSGDLADAVVDYQSALGAARESGDRATEIRALVDMAHIHVHDGEHAGAHEKLRAAQALAGSMNDRTTLGKILSALGHLAVEQDGGELEAQRYYQRALESHRRLGDRRMECECRVGIGLSHHLSDRTLEARTAYRSAQDLCRRIGHLGMESVCAGYLAILEVGEGDAPAAGRLIQEALVGARRAGYGSLVGLMTAYEGAVHALGGNLVAARQAFDESGLSCPDGAFGNCVAILRTFLEIGEARRAHASGDAAAARTHAEGAARTLAAGGREFFCTSADVRLAHGCTARSLVALRHLLGESAEMRVGPGGAWFKIDGALVDLRRRATLARVFALLVDQRERQPGGAASVEAILAAGWPGERISASSGAQRVHTAVWTLRRLGGSELIARDEQGYFINPDVSLVRIDRVTPEG